MNTLTSLAIIILSAMMLSSVLKQIKMPTLLAYIIVGIIFSPHVLNLISPNIMAISADLRQLALVIILTRAGLSLDINELKKVGRSAVLMTFVPATFEIIGYMILGVTLLNLSIIDAGIIGAIMSAVSPAVIVPRMIRIKDEGYGAKKGIPQMILSGASIDDVYVIVIFTSLIALSSGSGSITLFTVLSVPISIILGVAVGVLIGLVLTKFFKQFHIRDTAKVLIILSISFLLVALENTIKAKVPYSGLLSIIAMSMMVYKNHRELATRLSAKYNKLWYFAEILLFVMIGAIFDISYATKFGIMVVVVIALALLFRMAGVLVATIKSGLTVKEKLFCVIAYMPKATVQAGIGGIPLAMGLGVGNLALTFAVLAILLTAPIGAMLIDLLYKRLLTIE